jgi:tetratricopeptide (TPR) repeat protein
VRRYGNTDAVFKKVKYNNDAAWTAYRIGESFLALDDNNDALNYFSKAINLEPYNFEFRNKLGALQMSMGKEKEAADNFSFIYTENPKYVPAITNLGYYYLSIENNASKAEQLYQTALSLDPDNEQALLNMAGLYIFRKDFKNAKQTLEALLKKVPGNVQAKTVLEQIKAMNN